MKKTRETLRRIMFSSFGVVLLSAGVANSQQSPQSTRKEALIRDTYNKLTYYNRAANAQAAAEKNVAYDRANDLTFELRVLRTGPIQEINDVPVGQMVEKPGGDVLDVGRIIRSFNHGPEHVMYRAKWVASTYRGSLLEDWENTSVMRMLQLTDNSDVSEYTSYEVTLRFAGRERTYKAMVLHHDSFQTALEPRLDFLDNVVGQSTLANTFAERRPPVKAPWLDYVKSDSYKRYVQSRTGTSAKPKDENEDDTREMETTSSKLDPLLPEYCDFQRTYGPEKGKYRVDYQYHTSIVSWGQHDARSALRGTCLYDAYDRDCYVSCSVENTYLEVNEYGFPSSACHQSGSSIFYEDGTAPQTDGSTCSATVGVGFKACLFCACAVSINITPITVSSDGFWTYQHKLTHNCPCIH